MNVAQESQVSSKSFKFEFEQDVVDRRAHRRLDLNASTSSLLTADEQKTRWSRISGLSNADGASCISVLSLGIAFSEVYDE